MQRIKVLLVVVPLIILFNSFQDNMEKGNFLFCYGKVHPSKVKDYKYAILESKNFTIKDVARMRAQNEKVFAYISLGEINKHSNYFAALEKHTLGKNEIWNSYYIDLNSKKANEILLKMVDEIFSFGYDGLFLDNIDNFTIHGPQKDQTKNVINLIRQIKDKYPKKMYIQNAGLDLTEETSRYIDIIAIESIATNYDFKAKKCMLSEQNIFETKLNRINEISGTYSVPFILIEYADSNELAEKVRKRIVETGYDVFVGNIDLQTIPKFN
ncbi:MAG: endo alpha-1,4 polygalactosaminidase [Bacteroidota bacterium]